jgi:hypothetical protein
VLARCLDALVSFLARYVAFGGGEVSSAAASCDAVALWIALTYFTAEFEVSPRLAIQSPTAGSGKSTLLALLEQLVYRARRWIQPSDAVTFRVRSNPSMTLLIDAIDTTFAGGSSRRALLAILNEGYHRGASVARMESGSVCEFPVFGPVAMAGIGQLGPTLQSRSIVIELWKAPPDVPLLALDDPRHREAADEDAQALRAAMNALVLSHCWLMQYTRVNLPATITHRDAELWRPLFTIASLAGGDWPDRVTHAAEALTGHRADATMGLLGALRDLFTAAGSDRLSTTTILAALEARDDLPWGTTTEALTPVRLARLLAPFAIKPRTLRFRDGPQAKGYLRADFTAAWQRYLPLP